jgi:hypothetical protein
MMEIESHLQRKESQGCLKTRRKHFKMNSNILFITVEDRKRSSVWK